MIGKSLGPYKVVEPLGAGGMGEVYLGEDTRLGRKVAIKVLPAEFASDPERLARFEQEARAAAALNHPHIAVVHDVGSEAGEDGSTTHFIVQEFLEGQSLRVRLDKGALPLDTALELAAEVGEALVAAHKAGIVHRDLKPDNIFVTDEGHAKVLDFGLAKLMELDAAVADDASMSPTMLGTVAGQVMGTAGYMSPEQVGGDEIDRRADLFAFGCVLYEMVTGRRAFAGESVVQTLSKIAHDEPEGLLDFVEASPAELTRIVRKCLAKGRERRYQDADDLAVDLRRLRDDLAAGIAAAPAPGGAADSDMKVERPMARTLAGVAATALIAVAITLVVFWNLEPPDAGGVARFSIVLPEGASLVENRLAVAVSPDGRQIAHASEGGLYLRRLDEREPVLAVELASTPFFSADGSWLGYYDERTRRAQKVLLAQGSAPVTLESQHGGPQFGPTWDARDRILLGGPAVELVPADGVTPSRLLIELAEGEWALRPEFLPDGTTVIYTLVPATTSGEEGYRIVARPADGEPRILIEDATNATYLNTGHLAFLRDGALHAVAFDAERLVVTGAAVPLVEDISFAGAIGVAQFGISRNGLLVYAPAGDSADERLPVWVDRSGSETAIDIGADRYRYWRLSPDGQRLAARMSDPATGNADVYVIDLLRGVRTRLTSDLTMELFPLWAPDGDSVVYSAVAAESGFYRIAADGTGARQRITSADDLYDAQGWSPDAEALLYTDGNTLFAASVDGEAAPEPLLEGRFRIGEAAVSPDGNRLAYMSDETGQFEIYVSPFPDVGVARHRVSRGGGVAPRWNPAGEELFYKSPDGRSLFSVTVGTEPDIEIGAETVLLETDRFFERYDVAPDGQRFLMMKRTGGRPLLHVVQNWFEEVERRVPKAR